jgi:hypothetical protein
MSTPKEGFFSLGQESSDERQAALSAYAEAYGDNHGLHATANTTNVGRTFVGWDTNYSVKSDYTRRDYEYFRPNAQVPQHKDDIIRVCNQAYDKVGIVRNAIDLMGDFSSQGIRLQHPNPRIEQFYNKWWKKVNGKERSERFLNNFYRSGVVIVNKAFGRISVSQEAEMKKAHGSDDIKLEEQKVNKRRVPLKYSFINPLNVDILGSNISTFVGDPIYVLKLSHRLRTDINRVQQLSGRDSAEMQNLLKNVPSEIMKAINNGENFVILDPDKTSVFHYKKDDWSNWAKPMVFPILDDLMGLEKMKLADISALDGAISNIRLWTLGVLDGANSILPTKGMIQKLRNILSNNVGGGTMDLVWGPELSFQESNTQVHKFLGSEKYVAVLDAIYDGLGIPAALRSSGGTSNANNFISLKTLIERLEYGREVLTTFWEEEIRLVQRAMGFRFPATVVFDQMVLADEAAEKQLLINLVDRDLISSETLHERFNIKSNIENIRVNRESKKRGETMPFKAGQFHNPQFMEDLKKIALQGGTVTPSEVGLELEERKEGEKSKNDMLVEMQATKMASTNQKLDSGRPKNVTETSKRKPKSDTKPRQNAKGEEELINIVMWANEAQKQISDILLPGLLSIKQKKDIRGLSKADTQDFENLKCSILFSLSAYESITPEKLYSILEDKPHLTVANRSVIDLLVSRHHILNSKLPTVDELRQIQSGAFALQYDYTGEE